MTRKKQYIDADKAFEVATEFAGQAETKSAYAAFWKVAKEIRKMPTVEVVHGHWILREHDDGHGGYKLYHCSECDNPSANERKYCAECGAKMNQGSERIG